MADFFNTGLSQQQFLEEYWQKKPLLIRQAFANFESPISPEELAGLACDDAFESRLIQQFGQDSDWQLTSGPFTSADFELLPESHWTLLVQDLDKHLPELAPILQPFRFIPDWRRDDLMASYAPYGGSVGPHTDGYDVFLLQASGSRQWQISDAPVHDAALIDGLDLQVLSQFEADSEWRLEAGDMLYLPPHFAHHGIALNDCMTFSIGFRAPKQIELLDALVNTLLEKGLAQAHYSDSDLQLSEYEFEITSEAISRLKRLLHHVIDDAEPLLANALGRLITETKPTLTELALEQFSDLPAIRELDKQFEQGHFLQKNNYSRFAWSSYRGNNMFYVAGEAYELATSDSELIRLLAESEQINSQLWRQIKLDKALTELFCQLIADGVWLWQENE